MTYSSKNLKEVLQPYVFVLKEGSGIKQNFLDYSLMMLQTSDPEIIHSPQFFEKKAILALSKIIAKRSLV